jgi:hypothetical protein
MMRESDLVPNAEGRWIYCPCTGRVMLMRYHELIDVILEDAMPGMIRERIRLWVDEGLQVYPDMLIAEEEC